MGSVIIKKINSPFTLQQKYKQIRHPSHSMNIDPPFASKAQTPSTPKAFLRKQSMDSNMESGQLLLKGFKQDRRKLKDREQMNEFPYNCMGILSYQFYQNKNVLYEFSTGLLIGPRLVLGCAHFLFKSKERQARQIRFETVDGIVPIYKSQFPEQYTSKRLIEYDFCLFALKQDFTLKRYITICVNFNLCYFPAMITGFSEENKENKKKNKKLAKEYSTTAKENQSLTENWNYFNHNLLAYSMKGRIEENTSKYLQFDIDTIHGMSGSGILVQIYKNCIAQIGIHSGYYKSLTENGQKIKMLAKNEGATTDDLNSGCKLGNSFLYFLKKFCKQHQTQQPQVLNFDRIPDFLSINYYSLFNPSTEKKSKQMQTLRKVVALAQPQLQTGVFKSKIPNKIQRIPSMIIQQENSLKKIQQSFKSCEYRKCILLCQNQLKSNNSKCSLLQKAKICNYIGKSLRKNKQQQLATSYFQICCKILKKIYQLHEDRHLSQIVHQNCFSLSTLMEAANCHENNQHKTVIMQVLITSKQIKQELANSYLAYGTMENYQQYCRNSLQLFNDFTKNTQQCLGSKLLSLSIFLGSLMKSKKYQQWVLIASNNINIIHTAKKQSGIEIKIGTLDRNNEQKISQFSQEQIDIYIQSEQEKDEKIILKKDRTEKEQIFKEYFQNWVIDILEGLNSFSIELINQKDWIIMAFIISQIHKGVQSPQSKQIAEKLQLYTLQNSK